MKKKLLAVLAVVALAACGSKQAQPVQEETVAEETVAEVEFIRLNVPLKVKEGNAEKAITLAKQLIEPSLKDNGVMEYDMFKSETRPDCLLIFETWKDQASLDTHSATSHFTTLVPQIQALGEMAIEQFVQVKGQEQEGETVRINCHVVLKDLANKETLLKLAKELVAASQNDKGMVEYDIFSSVTRDNTLLIYETWSDQAALDVHSASDHFTRLVPQLQELADLSIEQFKK